MKKLLLLLAVALMLPVAALAQKMVPAYVVDNNGPVTNIRVAPNVKAQVAMTLPTDSNSYELILSQVKNGWWKIEGSIYEAENDKEIKLHGSKTGYWIHNSVVGFAVAGDPRGFLRDKPSTKSKSVMKTTTGDLLLHPLEVNGKWVKVVTHDGKHTGWMLIDKICSNSLTTCP